MHPYVVSFADYQLFNFLWVSIVGGCLGKQKKVENLSLTGVLADHCNDVMFLVYDVMFLVLDGLLQKFPVP